MIIGDTVRVLEPFSKAFPGVYAIEKLDGDTAIICGGSGFSVKFLEVTNEALKGYDAPPVVEAPAITSEQAQAWLKLVAEHILTLDPAILAKGG